MQLLIKNARILKNGKLVSSDILIEKGKIKKISKKIQIKSKSLKILDAKGNFAMPGSIDMHVHFREPGLTHKEDFLSGSMACAKGGITTFFDMPNTIPPTTTVERLEEKRNLAKKSVVNYGFHFGGVENNLSQIKKAKNIASVKLYLDHTTGNLKVDDWDFVADVMKNSRMTIVHAEGLNVKKCVDLMIKNRIKNRLHIAHTSSEQELNFAKNNKIKKRISVEVTPQHLYMTKEDVQKIGSYAEMKPSLKAKKDAAALWGGVKSGKVDMIATDHAPHLREEKEKADYPFGIPGVETMLPLLFTSFNEGKISLQKIQQLCCENPAKIFKIRSKGFLKAGYDADIAIADLSSKYALNPDDLLTKCKWSPFEGKTLKGKIAATIVNGNIIYEKGKITNINLKGKEVSYS